MSLGARACSPRDPRSHAALPPPPRPRLDPARLLRLQWRYALGAHGGPRPPDLGQPLGGGPAEQRRDRARWPRLGRSRRRRADVRRDPQHRRGRGHPQGLVRRREAGPGRARLERSLQLRRRRRERGRARPRRNGLPDGQRHLDALRVGLGGLHQSRQPEPRHPDLPGAGDRRGARDGSAVRALLGAELPRPAVGLGRQGHAAQPRR